MFKRLLAAMAIAAVCALPACNYGIYGNNNPPPVQFHTRMLVGNYGAGSTFSNVSAYTFPLSSASGPTSVIPGTLNGPNGARGVIEDNVGDLFVANQDSNTVIAYFPPVGSNSTPALILSNGIHMPQDMTFDNALDLYVANFSTSGNPAGTIAVFGSGLVNTSVPFATVSIGLNGPTSVTWNGASSIFVTNKTAGDVVAYGLPVSNSSAPSLTLTTGLTAPVAVAFDPSGVMYVADNATNKVDVYSGSLAGNPAPNFAIVTGVNQPRYLSFDPGGNLYVSNAGSITIYVPPFSGTSSPLFTITTGINNPYGVVVGI